MTQASSTARVYEPRTVTLNFRPRMDEQGENMLWFVSWIVGEDGSEGEWFYSGTSCQGRHFPAPAEAIGLRLRRWPSPGIDPEYVDLVLHEEHQVVTDRGLQFDRRQTHSLLIPDPVS